MWPCSAALINQSAYSSQPCWADASLAAALADGARRILRANPNTTVIVVDQLDGQSPPYLVCPTDRALNLKGESNATAMLSAVNSVAAALSAEFPSVRIMTNACKR